jgi:hypothetical protein
LGTAPGGGACDAQIIYLTIRDRRRWKMAEERGVVAIAESTAGPGSRVRTDWPGLVAAWRGSGQSQTVFCRERGLSRYRFGQWKVKLEGRDRRGGARLVRLKGMKVGSAGAGGDRIRLCVGGRYAVELGCEFDAKTLRRLLEVLEGR